MGTADAKMGREEKAQAACTAVSSVWLEHQMHFGMRQEVYLSRLTKAKLGRDLSAMTKVWHLSQK